MLSTELAAIVALLPADCTESAEAAWMFTLSSPVALSPTLVPLAVKLVIVKLAPEVEEVDVAFTPSESDS